MKRRALFLFMNALVIAAGAGVLRASPAEASAKAPPPCTDEYCDDLCVGRGYSFGYCNLDTMTCACVR